MITYNDIIAQFQSFKTRFNEFYALISGEVSADANLDSLNSPSKTAEYRKWMNVFSAMSLIMDALWTERQAEISAMIDKVQPTDRWLQMELFKFQYGDTLLWDAVAGKYYYSVIDPTKQIIKRCSVNSAVGITTIKVAKEVSGAPVALSGPELTAFTSYKNKIQWAGSNVMNPISLNSDKLDAPMTVYYDGTRPLDDIKAIVQAAFNEYLAQLPFNGEYSVNKHGDYIESKSTDIHSVDMGAVQAKSDGGVYAAVNRVYKPVSGYMVRDAAIAFDTMITYTAL